MVIPVVLVTTYFPLLAEKSQQHTKQQAKKHRWPWIQNAGVDSGGILCIYSYPNPGSNIFEKIDPESHFTYGSSKQESVRSQQRGKRFRQDVIFTCIDGFRNLNNSRIVKIEEKLGYGSRFKNF